MLSVRVGKTFADARKAYEKDLKMWEKTIEKVVDLFMRVNTEQAEIVSTVLFSARSRQNETKEKLTELDIYDDVMHWKKQRSPPIDGFSVAITIRNLAALGWLNVKASHDLPLPNEFLSDV